MMLAARGAFLAARRKKGWTNPYVTDGLVAMWDGEWNAGGGVSDPTTGKILDLCGGEPFIVNTAKGTLTGKSLLFNGRSATCNRTMTDFGTVECCFKLNSGRIVFYGCTKYQTGNTTPDFYAVWNRPQILEIIEMCGRQCHDTYQPRYTYGTRNTISRCGRDAYKNGVLSNNVTFNNTWGNQSVITIGSRVSTTAYDGVGELYNLRVYSQELTAEEIAANYAVDKARFNLP